MKITVSIFFIFLFFVLFYNILVSTKCKKDNFILNFNKFGLNIFEECINQVDIKNNVKRLLINNKFLYNFVTDIKVKFFKDFGKSRDIYKNLNLNDNIDEVKFEKVENIKGIIDNYDELKKFSINKKNDEINNKSWSRSHANNWNTKFFDSKIINKDNAKNLKLAWSYNPIEKLNQSNEWKQRIGVNPVYADGIVYFVSANWELNALDAKFGKLIWSLKFPYEIGRRGILWHLDKKLNKSHIFINAGEKLYKINSKTGKLEKKFGDSGSINVKKANIPPVIYKNQIIISNIQESKILSFDINSGELKFSKNIHPNEEIKLYSAPWGGAALDKKNGIYYVVTGNPKPNLKGIDRPSDNKNANSIIAFDLNTKKIIWSFQDVRHDLWDYDISAPPILTDLRIKNFTIEIVIVTTKTGNTFLFERKTGVPLFDINYKEAPKSNVPNEYTADKQIFIEKPERFSKIEFEKNDLRMKLLNDERFISDFEKKSIYGWFQPPTIGKDTIIYGVPGGNNWIGAAYNSFTQILYVPSNHIPYKIKIFPISKESKTEYLEGLDNYQLYLTKCASCHNKNRNGSRSVDGNEKEKNFIPSLVGFSLFDPLKNKLDSIKNLEKIHMNKLDINKNELKQLKKLFVKWDEKLKKNNEIFLYAYWAKLYAPDDILATKPPWGTISAIDVVNGKIIWQVPYGYEKNELVGTINLGGISISSSNLIFANGTSDNYATVINAENGEEIWRYEMKARGTTPPLIYEHQNKQYISYLSTGGLYPGEKKDSTLYTFTID